MTLELSARFAEQDFCRLCLSSIYELHALFPKGPNESNAILMSKISLLAEIILIPTEELNARICSRCIQQLEDFDSFRRRCKDSDSQIRKIRALQKWNDPAIIPPNEITAACKNTQTEQQEPVKFGGIFDLMMYSVYYPAALGEYYMLFDGSVYRKESLLVWRCELPNCPCQLLVENDFGKFWVYGTHNHAKLSSDPRKFVKMDRRICAFLNKLRDQMDGTTEKVQDKAAGSQNSALEARQTVPSNSESVEIQYSTEGDKPSIVVNSHRYYKEAVNSDVDPLQIYWRCNDKNCLGMIITSADLRTYMMYKDHNHALKSVPDRSSIQMDFPVRVAALPMNRTGPSDIATARIQSSIAGASTSMPKNAPLAPNSTLPESTSNPNETSKKRNAIAVLANSTKQAKPNDISACAIPVTLPKNQSPMTRDPSLSISSGYPLMTFYKDSKNYFMYLYLFLYQREVCYSSPTNAEVLWKCMAAKCPGTMIVFQNLKFAPGLAHNHGTINWSIRNMTKVSSAEALTKPVIVPEISFYRCWTNEGIRLLYKQFIYGVRSFESTDAITWQCRSMGCDGQLRSGMQFEYLTTVKNHNHGPVLELTVDVESYLTVEDALKELKEKPQNPVKLNYCSQLQDQIQKRVTDDLKISKRNQMSLKQRRKSTWC